MVQSDITAYVSDLLYKYDCVILPDFGGFITNYSSAEVLPSSNYFTPPSKTLAFNMKLNTNDGLLFNYIAYKQGISYRAAQDKVEQFVEWIKDKLAKEGEIRLQFIGKFILEHEDNIRFVPDWSVNHLADAYGLKRFHFEPIRDRVQTISTPRVQQTRVQPARIEPKPAPAPVQRTLPTPVAPAKVVSIGERSSKRNLIAIAATVAVIAVLAAMSQFISFDSTNVNSSNLNPFSETATEPNASAVTEAAEPGNATEAENTNEPITEKVVENTVKEEVKAQNSGEPAKGYYIILGSFKSRSHAEKQKKQLEAQNLNAFVFKAPNGYNRVGYYVAPSESEAESMLQTLKSKHGKDAWLMEHEG